MKDSIAAIVCPHCGQTYLPAEIYTPNSFFGKPKEVFRNPDGTIDFFIGDEPDMTETFTCENCGALLYITANLSFDVSTNEFDEEYVSEIDKPTKIHLSEETLFD